MASQKFVAICARIIGTVFAIAVKLLAATWRVDARDLDKIDRAIANGGRLLVVFWHGKYFSLLPLGRSHHAAIITTDSFRGKTIAAMSEHLGYVPILLPVGKTTERLSIIRKAVGDDTSLVAMAVDGPIGPFHLAKRGAIQLSAELDLKLIPITVRSHLQLKFSNRWDEHEVPLPFAGVKILVGDPIDVPPHLGASDPALLQRLLTDRLNAL